MELYQTRGPHTEEPIINAFRGISDLGMNTNTGIMVEGLRVRGVPKRGVSFPGIQIIVSNESISGCSYTISTVR